MHFTLLTLLTALATLAPALVAASSAKHGALAGRDAALKHRDIGRVPGHRRKVIKRTCKAKTSGTTSVSSVAAIVATSSAIGENAQATGSATASAMSSVATSLTASSVNASTGSAVASSSASAASTSSSAGSSASGGATVKGKAALTPNGNKAGMTLCTGIDAFSGKLGWCYDWTPTPSPPSGMVGVSMLWGDGSLGSTENDASRVSTFESLSTAPEYIIGFEEPDCSTTGSADMSVADSATAWNTLIAPYGAKGSLLISPSMCHQADETFLTPFKQLITTDWDITNLHINKKDMAGVKKDLDYYWNTYGKPMWVTEFACVEDQSWTPCTDQTEIDQFISDIVKIFEEDSRVYAYAYSNGKGLGDVWPAVSDGQLTASGQAYLSAVSQYH